MISGGSVRTEVLMGTVVSISVLARGADAEVEQAFEWFRRVEAACSRFNPSSELMQLVSRVGIPTPASPILYETVQFALAVAAETGGAFDPTMGAAMETRGFTREYSTGERRGGRVAGDASVSYRDVELDAERRTITICRPMILDLGAVAKGLAVDTAAQALARFEDFVVDAGGDLFLSGRNSEGEPWSVGIRHPRLHDAMIETLRISNRAVCTSGDYERMDDAGARAPHIVDPRTHEDATAAASVTVIAPTAMLADALATTAFVLGPREGVAMLERAGVQGVIYSAALERFATAAFPGDAGRDEGPALNAVKPGGAEG